MGGKTRVPSQARAIRTRRALVAAGEKEFSKRGYASTTVKTISTRAGVAAGTFYQYFVDKDELLREIASSRLSDLAARTLPSIETKVPVSAGPEGVVDAVLSMTRGLVEIMLDEYRSNLGFRVVMLERRLVDELLDERMREVEQQIVDRLAVVLKRWSFPGDARATAHLLGAMAVSALNAHTRGPETFSDERLVDALSATMTRVVLPIAFVPAPRTSVEEKKK